MNKIKNLFSTPKRTIITIISCLAILAVLSTSTAVIANAVAKSSSIGEENAKNFAFADAGIDPVSAESVYTKFDFEQEQFVYEVKFTANGTEYEYWIKASDGSIVKKQVEIVKADGTNTTASAQITMDAAKEIALADAGLKLSDVTFVKEKLDVDNDISVYDIEFFAENTEYEYEINANTGTIYSKSKETTLTKSDTDKTDTDNRKNDKNSQSSQQNVSQQSSSQTDTQQNNSQQNNNQQSTSQTQSDSTQISLEEAKSTALADAGVSASQVTFTKAKKDYDDGIIIYKIKFYTSTHEYEYKINAANGKVLSKEADALDDDDKDHEKTSGNYAGNADSYIGIDKAKSIAVSHAGFSVSDVTFSKAQLDDDDGYIVYEIEFYKDNTEYEYTINASNGAIMEYDSEWDDD